MAFRNKKSLDELRINDDGFPTRTTEEQTKVEDSVIMNHEVLSEISDSISELLLQRKKHIQYCTRGLSKLSSSYECLDASRPWLCYWILHSLELLDQPITQFIAKNVAEFLIKCQSPRGGFGGGPGQLPHLAPTYAAVCAISICGLYYSQAYEAIDREGLFRFLLRCHTSEGAFRMHYDGEVDIRGAYCAAVAARLTNVYTPKLFENTGNWIKCCQTYEGGFSGEPGNTQIHGGYSFCGVAALVLLGEENKINIQKLLKWTSQRQMRLEGGFQGRTNKLVDGCYSLWQGGVFPIIHHILKKQNDQALSDQSWMFDRDALQTYILVNCQYPTGGLVDKPGKVRDFYHTCYCLSGLSVAQNFHEMNKENVKVIGRNENLLNTTHPIFNIGIDSAMEAVKHFNALDIPKVDE
ncbi:protein farnesyltransferase subunit beta-like [Xenia sp. Carnegie-2017]|uniref:protein farnesyltransferase subunit beta-like n=1 Tax=Xenia sp. Carnegie-2017 TaxID=2897299 RepID=UPI001F03D8CB|nr:protein farnesyltransferase subunit beta-like [Xenia sp. Carnegie-2017]